MVYLILAIVSATGFALTIIIAFSALATPLDLMLTAFNESMATFTGMTGRAWTSFNGTQQMIRTSWFPIAGILLFFAVFFVYLHAQRKEYVTGQF